MKMVQSGACSQHDFREVFRNNIEKRVRYVQWSSLCVSAAIIHMVCWSLSFKFILSLDIIITVSCNLAFCTWYFKLIVFNAWVWWHAAEHRNWKDHFQVDYPYVYYSLTYYFMFAKNRHCLPRVMQPLECIAITLCHCFVRFDSMGFFGFLFTFFTTLLVVRQWLCIIKATCLAAFMPTKFSITCVCRSCWIIQAVKNLSRNLRKLLMTKQMV